MQFPFVDAGPTYKKNSSGTNTRTLSFFSTAAISHNHLSFSRAIIKFFTMIELATYQQCIRLKAKLMSNITQCNLLKEGSYQAKDVLLFQPLKLK